MDHLNILVIGSGPSGCYTVDALTKEFPEIHIDVIDSRPFPFGLLRSGVAPDHIKIKSLQSYFHNILDKPNVSFYGNVTFGQDILLADIHTYYHAIFICTGTQFDRKHPKLDYSSPYIWGSRPIVEWYNGYSTWSFQPYLSATSLTLFGIGNVSLDIARIFLKSPAQLQLTEMNEKLIHLLKQSSIHDIHIFARRGPAQAKCTPLELKELFDLEHVNIIVNPESFQLSAADQQEIKESRRVRENVALFQQAPIQRQGKKNLYFHFNAYLDHITELQMGSYELQFKQTLCKGEPFKQELVIQDSSFKHQAELIVSAIGYEGQAVADIPFDTKTTCIPNTQGKILYNSSNTNCLIYTAGWIKRGAQGVIGTNKRGAKETVNSFLADIDKLNIATLQSFNLAEFLTKKKLTFTTFDDWKTCDLAEIDQGKRVGKQRVKITELMS